MRNAADATGTSLTELVFTLSLLAVLFGLAYPPLASGLDRLAARSARDALASGLARARATAVARGGAVLVVDVDHGRLWVEAAGRVVGEPVDLAAVYGVRVAIDGTPAERVAIRFDGLGIGRVANRTFRLRRGDAETRLTVSSFGRPRSW